VLNRVELIGYLGKAPEVRFLNTGTAVCHFSVATSQTWTDQQGQKQERTEWHRIVAWKKLGEACGKVLDKGWLVHIEGRIQTRSYDKDGEKRYATEIVAERVLFLRAPKGDGSQAAANGEAPPPSDDDIPF
jgi:single-strand DNA-binding protein